MKHKRHDAHKVRPFALAPLIAAIAVVGANSLSLTAIANLVAANLPHASAPDVMLGNAAYGGGVAVAALLLARQADRIGLKYALAIALTALAAALAASAVAPTLAGLIAAQTAAGLAAGVALPATYGLAAEIAPQGRESQTLGATLVGWTIGMVFGVGAAAAAADIVGWRAVYAGLAAIAAGVAIAVAGAGPLRNRAGEVGPWPHHALRIAGVPGGLAICLAYMTAFYGLYAYLGPHLTGLLGQSATIVGFAAIAYGLGFGGVAPLDRLIDRYGPSRAAPAIFSALAVAYLGLALAENAVSALIALCVLWGGANHLGLNIVVGRLSAIDPKRRATILGLYSATSYAAMLVGVAVFKPIFQAGGWSLCALCAAGCVCAGLLSMRRAAAR